MTRDDLDLEIRDLAEDIASTGPAWQQITEALLALHHSTPAADGLDLQVLRLAGPDSLTTLIALLLEDAANSKPVAELPAPDRTAVKSAYLALADGLNELAHNGLAEDAAGRLNPA